MSTNPTDLAGSLSQLTSGWITTPGVPPEALAAARTALAGSLIAGKSLQDTHPELPRTGLIRPGLQKQQRAFRAKTSFLHPWIPPFRPTTLLTTRPTPSL